MGFKTIINKMLGKTTTTTQTKVIEQEIKAMTTTVKTVETFQGRWGFYPVSQETFLKLKYLHKWYFITLRHLGTWVRWDRKTKHRKGSEPKYCEVFVDDKVECRKHVNKEGFTEWRWYPKTRADRGIREAYQVARMPKKTPEEVEALKISNEEIDKLYARVHDWVEKHIAS